MFKNNEKKQNLEMHQISNASQSSSVHEAQNSVQMQQLQEQNKQKHKLNNQRNVNESSEQLHNQQQRGVSTLQIILQNKKKITKWVLIFCLILITIWLAFNFLTQNLSKTRHPMFLSSFNPSNNYEVMSPLESDYESFQYYKMMLNISKYLAVGNRGAQKEELKKFQNMTFKQFYNTYKVIRTIQLAKEYKLTKQDEVQEEDDEKFDQAVNLTQYFREVVNQFQCASCYSFPIAATVQYLYMTTKSTLKESVKLSQQQLIDCAHDQKQQNGCEQGNITRSFEYVRDVGLVTEADYPYRSIKGVSFNCDLQAINRAKKRYRISGFKVLPGGRCQSIQKQLSNGKAVAAMINAGALSQYLQEQGAFSDCKRHDFNHAITIVGQTDKNQWIVRNSWGKNWGKNGYFLMGHGNTCGVCQHAIVPILQIDNNGTIVPYNQKDEKKTKQT